MCGISSDVDDKNSPKKSNVEPQSSQNAVKIPRRKNHPCNSCSKTFPENWRLRRHMRERHSAREDAIFCKRCGSKLKNKGSLDKHIQVGSCKKAQDKPYPCLGCGKRYRSKKYLRQHMRDIHPESKTMGNSGMKTVKLPAEPVPALVSSDPSLNSDNCREAEDPFCSPNDAKSDLLVVNEKNDSEDSSTSFNTGYSGSESESSYFESYGFLDMLKSAFQDPMFSETVLGEDFLNCDALDSSAQEVDNWNWLIQFKDVLNSESYCCS